MRLLILISFIISLQALALDKKEVVDYVCFICKDVPNVIFETESIPSKGFYSLERFEIASVAQVRDVEVPKNAKVAVLIGNKTPTYMFHKKDDNQYAALATDKTKVILTVTGEYNGSMIFDGKPVTNIEQKVCAE